VFLVPLKLFAFSRGDRWSGTASPPLAFAASVQGCVGQRQHAVEFGQRAHDFGGHRVGDRVAVGAEHAAFERRAILARSPHQPYAVKMDRERELKIIRRAYAKQVTAAAAVYRYPCLDCSRRRWFQQAFRGPRCRRFDGSGRDRFASA
jgi:hypothetical protein